MKRLFFIMVMCCSFNVFSSAPNFTVDSTTDLAGLKGQVVYIDFWASWCKPCRASFPWMNKMTLKYKDKGLTVIAVNLDEDSKDANEFLKQLPASFQIVYDPQGNIAQQYDLVGMPSSYIIDKKGELRIAHQGFFTAKTDAYENEIVKLLSE